MKTITEMKKALNAAIKALNEALSTEKNEAITKRLEAIDKDCKTLNDAIFHARLAELMALDTDDHAAMFNAWLDDRTVPTYSVKQSAKDGDYSLKEKAAGQKTSRHIFLTDLELAYQTKHGTKHADGTVEPDTSLTLCKSKRYYRMLAYFTHNLAVALGEELSAECGKDRHAVVPKMMVGNADEAKEMDFSGTSIGELQKQLNCIVEEILPATMTLKMNRADVRAIQQAYTREKHLEFTGKTEKQVLDNIIDAIQTRRANIRYVVNSKADCHKEGRPSGDRTEKQEADVSRASDREHENQQPEQPKTEKPKTPKKTSKKTDAATTAPIGLDKKDTTTK